jgi:hypothetical protein
MMPTARIGKLSQPGGPRYGIEHSNEGLITFPGGLPIVNGDGVLIGVSGSAVENDHLVAKAGVKVIGLVQDWRDGKTTQGCACPVRALATQDLLWPSPRQHHTQCKHDQG